MAIRYITYFRNLNVPVGYPTEQSRGQRADPLTHRDMLEHVHLNSIMELPGVKASPGVGGAADRRSQSQAWPGPICFESQA